MPRWGVRCGFPTTPIAIIACDCQGRDRASGGALTGDANWHHQWALFTRAGLISPEKSGRTANRQGGHAGPDRPKPRDALPGARSRIARLPVPWQPFPTV